MLRCVLEIQAHLLQAQLTPACVLSAGYKNVLLNPVPWDTLGKVLDVKTLDCCIAQFFIVS